MSTVNDILQRTTELVQSLEALIETDAVQALPGVAEQLGATELLNGGVDLLVTALDALVGALAELDPILDQLSGFGALFGLLEPLVDSLAGMIQTTATAPAAWGFQQGADTLTTIATGVGYVGDAMAVANALIVAPERFDDLVASLASLKQEFEALKVEAGEGASA
jgi:hypothetical protein